MEEVDESVELNNFGSNKYEPDNESFMDLAYWIISLCETIAPSCVDGLSLEANHNRSRVQINLFFEEERNIGLILGKKCVNMRAMLQLIRSQQIYVHNRYIEVRIHKKSSEVQSFCNRTISKKGA